MPLYMGECVVFQIDASKRVRRFERPTFTLATCDGAPITQPRMQISCDFEQGVVKNVATQNQAVPNDEGMNQILYCWSRLPDYIRRIIVHIVEIAGEGRS
mgnify:CR=1 FL=1